MSDKVEKTLVETLKNYKDFSSKIEANPSSKKEMDAFKTYYKGLYKKLSEHILAEKDKAISDLAKQLPILSDLFSTFNKYMALLIFMFIGPSVLMVYLYTLNDYINFIYAIIAIDVIALFFIVKEIQKEAKVVIHEIVNANKTINLILKKL